MQKFEIEIESKGGGGFAFANEVIEAGEGDKLDARLYDHEMILCRRQLCSTESGNYREEYCIHRIAYRDIASLNIYQTEGGYINLYFVCRNLSYDQFSIYEDVEACRERVKTPCPHLATSTMVHSERAKVFLRELYDAIGERLLIEGDIYSLCESSDDGYICKKEIHLGERGEEERGYGEDAILSYVTSHPSAPHTRTYTLLRDALLIGENRGEWVEERIPLANLQSLVKKPYGYKTLYALNIREEDRVRTISEYFIYNESAVAGFLSFFDEVRKVAPSFSVITPDLYRAECQLGEELKTFRSSKGVTIKVYKKGVSVDGNVCLYRDITCFDNEKKTAGYHYFTLHAKPSVPFGAWVALTGSDLTPFLEIHEAILTRCRLAGASFIAYEIFRKKVAFYKCLFGPLSLALPAPQIYRGVTHCTLTMRGEGFEICYLGTGEKIFIPYADVLTIATTYKSNLYLYTREGYLDLFDADGVRIPAFREKLLAKVKKENPEVLSLERKDLYLI